MKELFERLYTKSSKEYCVQISKYLDNSIKKFIVTANPETIEMAKSDKVMRDILLDPENDVIPDSIAIVRGAKKMGFNVEERITGIDTAVEILKLINNKKKSLYIFGSTEEVIEGMRDMIKKDYPCITLLGATNGFVEDKNSVMEEIVSLNPDVVFIAMGIPKQEYLINKYIKKARKGVYMGVGGTFDVLSGMKKRAPKLFIKLNLEWLYRIVCEPSRLKRFYKNNIKFMREVYKESKKK